MYSSARLGLMKPDQRTANSPSSTDVGYGRSVAVVPDQSIVDSCACVWGWCLRAWMRRGSCGVQVQVFGVRLRSQFRFILGLGGG